MQCPVCNTFIDNDTVFCGNCGRQVRPLRAQGETLDFPMRGQTPGSAAETIQGIAQTRPANNTPSPLPRQEMMAQSFTPTLPLEGRVPPRGSTPTRFSQRTTILAALLVLILAGGTGLTLALLHARNSNSLAGNASGQVVFLDSRGGVTNMDELKISINDLQAAPAGSQYNVWLIDTESEQVNPLGVLHGSGTTFSLDFKSSQSANLLSLGNEILVTQEQGQVKLPSGQTLFSVAFPPKALVHIKHLLLSFPSTPGKIGLLIGLLAQAKLLDGQAQVLQGIAADNNTFAQECVARSILDIIEGQSGAHYQPLSPDCGATTTIGDGFGILGTNGYAATAATHAALAASQSDSTANIRSHASEVEAATTNITKWVTTIQQDVLAVLDGQVSPTAIAEIAALAQRTDIGVDANGNGRVEAIPGEAGAINAYTFGQLMATLPLAPAKNN